MTEINLKLPAAYLPLMRPYRYKVYYGGRGSGKSESFARALLVQGMAESLPTLCTRELQASIQDSVHRLLATIIAEEGMAEEYEVLGNTIRSRKNDTEFIFRGLKHNITEIKGLARVKRVWAEEAENISDRSWEMLIPTIREPGSEIWISFNTRNPTDPTFQRFVANEPSNSYVKKVSYRDNPFFPDVLRQEMMDLLNSNPDAYSHIWDGEFDERHSGAIYATYVDRLRERGDLCPAPYQPGCPVVTAWDLGRSDATCITFAQIVGREPRIIDYHAATGSDADLAELAKELRSRPYEYKAHFLPHDGEHERQGMPGSIVRQLRDMGLTINTIPRGRKKARIEAGRKLLSKCVINKGACDDLVHALMNYRYEWDEARQMFKADPLHDWASDPADSFGYLAQALEMGALGQSTKKVSMMRAPGSRII